MKKAEKSKKVIVRFPPSPTGSFHIGSARTALFNYLFAQKNNGKFLLRIEDTDKERSKPEFENDIIGSLNWLGISWDGDIVKQSQRVEVYKKHLEKLLKDDKAYYCFCSPEDLEASRQEQMSRGVAPKYNGKCSDLSKAEIEKNLAEGKKPVIRFRTPAEKIIFTDLVRGDIEFDSGLIGDFVIAKDPENPLYNFTVVVDDSDMEITHIIRGEDHIPNTPKQILLQEALGFARPEYAHLPLILGTDRSKLSKRHGAVSLGEYRKEGYLKEAIINFVAFLGWNPGNDKEIYAIEELIKDFKIEQIQKSGAIFNIEKLNFINGVYIREKPIKELAQMCRPYLKITGQSDSYIEKSVLLYQDRLKKLSEIGELTDFLFTDDLEYNKELLIWKDARAIEVKTILDKIIELVSDIRDNEWKKEKIESILTPEAEAISVAIRNKKDRGYVLWAFRVALTGKKSSAGPFEIAEVLGKQKTIQRVEEAIKIISKE